MKAAFPRTHDVLRATVEFGSSFGKTRDSVSPSHTRAGGRRVCSRVTFGRPSSLRRGQAASLLEMTESGTWGRSLPRDREVARGPHGELSRAGRAGVSLPAGPLKSSPLLAPASSPPAPSFPGTFSNPHLSPWGWFLLWFPGRVVSLARL